jgi:GSH-dependent disulfide-bond oxidoreductase
VITLYTVPTANGQKVTIALEECGLPYQFETIDLQAGAHKRPAFLALNPLGKAPALLDPDGPGGAPIALGETGAMVFYLCRKAGGGFMAQTPRAQAEQDFWAFAINASLAMPLAMQFYHANLAPERADWAIDAMTTAARTTLSAFERHLEGQDYLLGAQFSAVDMLLYPHLATSAQRLPGKLTAFPALEAYCARVGARPGVQRGMMA